MDYKNEVIVLGAHFNALSITQVFFEEKIKCYVVSDTPDIAGLAKSAQYIKSSNPIGNEKKFVDELLGICMSMNNKPVVIPTGDQWACAISKYYDLLSVHCHLCVSKWDTVEVLIEKDKFYKIGEEKGFLTPRTWNSKEILHTDMIVFPIIAKPEYRISSSEDEANVAIGKMLSSNRMTVLSDRDELQSFIADNTQYLDRYIFQEYIRGNSDQMYTFGVFCWKGEVWGEFVGRKVRGFPYDVGDCIVGENSKLPEHIIDSGREVLKYFNYSGIAELEYKRDSDSGQYKLIEINPRSWSWVGITPRCNVNLPLMAYKYLIGEPISKASSKYLKPGSVKYIKVIEDFVNCSLGYRKSYKLWGMNVFKWYREVTQKNVVFVYAEFNGDLKIALKALFHLFPSKLKTVLFDSDK